MNLLAKFLLSLALLTPVSGRAAGVTWHAAWVTTGAGRGTPDWMIDADVSWHGTVSLSRSKSALPSRDAFIATGLFSDALPNLLASSLSDLKKPWETRPKPATPSSLSTPSFPGFATINAGTLLMNGTLAAAKNAENSLSGSLPFGATANPDETSSDSSALDAHGESSSTLDITSSTPLALTQLATGAFMAGSQLTLVNHRGGWVNTELLALAGAGFGDDSIITLDPTPLFERFDQRLNGNQTIQLNPSADFGNINVVPEPSTGLFVILLGMIAMRRRRSDPPTT